MTAVGPFVGTLQDAAGNRLVAGPGGFVYVPADSPLPPPPPPPPTPAGGRQVSVYVKMWPGSKLPGLAAIAKPGITEVRLAFMQGTKLVGWGSQTPAQARADVEQLRGRGVRITASIGGESGSVNTADRTGWLAGIGALHAQIGLDRIDWDVEASALRADDVLFISQAVHDRWGILSTMAPNGSNVGAYLPVAVELHKRGLLAAYGQQFYDAPVSLDAAKGRISQAIAAGLPSSLIQVGMMVGSDSRHWTIDTCATNARAVKAQWPDIGGAYLWSEQHTEVAAWATAVIKALA